MNREQNAFYPPSGWCTFTPSGPATRLPRGAGSRHPPRPLGALRGAERLFQLGSREQLGSGNQARRARASSRRAPRRCRSTSWRPERSLASSLAEAPLVAARSSIRRVRASSWLANEESSASTWSSVDPERSMSGSLADTGPERVRVPEWKSPPKPQQRPRMVAGSVTACCDASISEETYRTPQPPSGPSCRVPTWVVWVRSTMHWPPSEPSLTMSGPVATRPSAN